ncbi:translocator protein 2 isoform X2 [Prionailurus viverrinus]|uniref:translocator protein 2 isoform X2 n=1 Tax=Prionailurus viverrinus TaxID=61388 RepID=UPI001FF1E7A8|nr:translocator protein 2 isoform X2 [Prionailurus viverrinus]
MPSAGEWLPQPEAIELTAGRRFGLREENAASRNHLCGSSPPGAHPGLVAHPSNIWLVRQPKEATLVPTPQGLDGRVDNHLLRHRALLHLLLLYGLVVSTALIWHPINKLAAVLLLPYLAWLTVTASIAYRLWRDSLCPSQQPQPSGEKSD